MTLADISIRRPVFAWMLMSALMIFGFISFTRMGVSQLPNVDFPVITVELSWEGAAPAVMEADVVDLVEGAMATIQGVKSVNSTMRQGKATVTVEFELERNIDAAFQEVQARLSQIERQLPKDLDPPVITKVNPEDQPIVWITATGNIPLRELMEYVQNHLKDKFTTISGVGEIFLGGFIERNLRIWIDAKKLEEYQLTVQDIIDAVQKGHIEIPAGRIETNTQELNVRSMGEAPNVAEFENIVILKRAGQPIYRPIYLKDVAGVEDGLADVRRLSRTNGEPAVGLGIRKQRGVNEVDVAKRVLERLEEVKKDLPPGIHLNLVVNRARFSEDSINELKFTLVLSAIVTSIVCLLFLGSWSATLNILLAIPTSILGTFIFIHFFGFTLNTFTLLGLSLAIGIVVDDAIMVLENITRYREKGSGRIEAAQIGAKQITFAATATTIAIIAIFAPIIFMKGVMGKFFAQYAITISVAVAISLLEALTLTPMRCSQFLQAGQRVSGLGKGIDRGYLWLSQQYHKKLERALQKPRRIIAGAVIFFIASLILFMVLRKEFLPSQDQSMFLCRLQTPVGSSITLTDERFKRAEQFILKRPEALRYFAAIGGFTGGEVNQGIIFVILKPPQQRPAAEPFKRHPNQKEIMAFYRKELNKIPDLKAIIQDMSLSSFSAQRGFPIEFTILGPDWDQLAEFSKTIQNRMKESGLMVDVDTNYLEGVTEIQVYPDREKAAEYGVSIDAIGQTINALIAGEKIAKYTSSGRRYDVRLRLLPSQRSKAEDIEQLWLWNNRGELVQLKDVVTMKEKKTPLTITRADRERAITISANVAAGKSQVQAMDEVNRAVKEVLPYGYRISFSGTSKTFKESFQSLFFVLWLGILVSYMVLASQFNSYVDPLIILMSLPFSISGALFALWVCHQSLNIFSFVGIILLMGIVKKNAILLVEFTNQLRAQGKEIKEALLEASPIRLRPILMTSLSTIAAAIPPALALGPGSEVLVPMATTVIGGMILSTFFTLFVIPCLYSFKSRK